MLRFTRGSERRTIQLARTYGGEYELAVQGAKTKYAQFPTRIEGLIAYHAMVADVVDQGFVLEVDGHTVTKPSDQQFVALPELENAVEADPENTEVWMVLGDAWTERGDPRGPCINLSRAFENVRDPAQFAANKKAAAAAHGTRANHLLGALGRDAYRVTVEHAHGLPVRLALVEERGAPGRSTPELVASLLASPFCRFVRELRVEGSEHEAEIRELASRIREVHVRS